MKQYEEVQAYRPYAMTCDACGKKYHIKNDVFEYQEFFHIKQLGGYGSVFGDAVADGTGGLNLHICQHCMYRMITEVCPLWQVFSDKNNMEELKENASYKIVPPFTKYEDDGICDFCGGDGVLPAVNKLPEFGEKSEVTEVPCPFCTKGAEHAQSNQE